MSFELLCRWNRLVGEVYETENKAFFFYSLVKMQKPERMLEIGTGAAVSSLFMAQAARENGRGLVFTVDDASHWQEFYEPFFTDRIGGDEVFGPRIERDFFATMDNLAETLGLKEHIRFLPGRVALADVEPIRPASHPALAPALEAPLDLIFCDVDHRPDACLGILAKFLPLCAPHASIFIDSAPTHLASHLTLVETVRQLEAGKIPAWFLAGADEPLRAALQLRIASSRFTLVPLTERKDRDDNSLAWIRIEPANVLPYPLTSMRGMHPTKNVRLPGSTLEALFGGGGDQSE